MMKPHCGYGPWFCALLYNTHNQTRVLAHTTPHLEVDALNASSTAPWAVVLKVGPFESWATAADFLQQWTPTRTVERGMQLFACYHIIHNLHLWASTDYQLSVLQGVYTTTGASVGAIKRACDVLKPPKEKKK